MPAYAIADQFNSVLFKSEDDRSLMSQGEGLQNTSTRGGYPRDFLPKFTPVKQAGVLRSSSKAMDSQNDYNFSTYTSYSGRM